MLRNPFSFLASAANPSTLPRLGLLIYSYLDPWHDRWEDNPSAFSLLWSCLPVFFLEKKKNNHWMENVRIKRERESKTLFLEKEKSFFFLLQSLSYQWHFVWNYGFSLFPYLASTGVHWAVLCHTGMCCTWWMVPHNVIQSGIFL